MSALAKNPAAIKLFGRTISLPETQFSNSHSLDNGSNFTAKTESLEFRNGTSLAHDEVVSFEQPQTSTKQPVTSQAATNPNHLQDQSESSGEPKQMKKRDRIVPCPRCNSFDTKFCYFNNYNVNQPRHYCKSCQRYWTTGGTVRNVPVGAGRRRNKHLASQYRPVMASTDVGLTMVSETFDSTNQLLTSEESSSSSSPPNHKMVLKFGPESPYCDNAGASLTASSFGTRPVNNNDVSSQHQMYHYVVPPQSHITTSNVRTSNSSLSLALPGFATPNMTYQLVPATYMNCVPPLWVAGSGNVSLVMSNGSQLQVLGKHSRDVNGAPEGSTAIEEDVSAPKSSKNS